MADLDDLTDMRPRNADERAVWRSFNGCDCPTHYSDGKRLRASERCTATAVRCNGRLSTIAARLREMRATPPRAGKGEPRG